MSNHPLNLALRFGLEITAIALTFYWGWTNFSFPTNIITAIFLPLILMSLWGGLRYPKDHGKGLIKVSGKTRLVIEAVVLSTPIILNVISGNLLPSLIFFAVVAFHYIISRDRVVKLLHD